MVVQIFEKMKKDQVSPNIRIWMVLARALGCIGEHQKMLQTLNGMKEVKRINKILVFY
jgi:hypothetical protein